MDVEEKCGPLILVHVAVQGSGSNSKPVQGPRGSKQRQRMLDRAEVWAKGEWTEDPPAAATAASSSSGSRRRNADTGDTPAATSAARGSVSDDEWLHAASTEAGVPDSLGPSSDSLADLMASDADAPQPDVPEILSRDSSGSVMPPKADASQAEDPPPQSSKDAPVGRGRKRRGRPVAR